MPKYNINFMYESGMEADNEFEVFNNMVDDLKNCIKFSECIIEVSEVNSKEYEENV